MTEFDRPSTSSSEQHSIREKEQSVFEDEDFQDDEEDDIDEDSQEEDDNDNSLVNSG